VRARGASGATFYLQTTVDFIHEPPSIAQGGRGVVVPGCPACRKRINTMGKFLDHLAEDAMPALIEKLSGAKPR